MAKSGIQHANVGDELSKTEWLSEESHELVHGSSFPASPVERQLFYRDDEHIWYIRTNLAWVSLQAAGGGGVTDHGELDGLADDDHSQYLNVARHDLVARHPLAVLDTAVCSETEADSKITTHKGDASAHHTKTVSSEIDHGSVQGLGDDDHSQYLNVARHDLTARHTLGTVVPHESALNNLGDVNAPSPSDDQALAWDAATSKWIPQTLGGGGGGSKIQDADGDTSWDVEQAADEDKVHGKVKGVEAFLLDDAGVLTLAKNSRARAYRATSNQSIPNTTWTKVQLNAGDFDTQNEFDSVTNYRFTAKAAGIYFGACAWVIKLVTDGALLGISIRKNGAVEGNSIGDAYVTSGAAGDAGMSMPFAVELAADDYLEMYVYQDCGVAKDLSCQSRLTWFFVAKIG